MTENLEQRNCIYFKLYTKICVEPIRMMNMECGDEFMSNEPIKELYKRFQAAFVIKKNDNIECVTCNKWKSSIDSVGTKI